MEKQNALELDWGLLWFDNDPGKPMSQKVTEAATGYRLKHAAWPNLCYVHPSMFQVGSSTLVNRINVVVNKTVLKDHFWIGVSKEKADDTRATT